MITILGSHETDLAVRYCGDKPALPPKLEAWPEVFLQWHAVHRRYAVQEGHDVGWWWRERPQVGFLTAAIWMAGGSALQEYRAVRKVAADSDESGLGRADLFASLGGLRYTFEAKHCYVRPDTPGTEKTVASHFAAAEDAVARLDEGYDLEGALLFVGLYTKAASVAETQKSVADFRGFDFGGLRGKTFPHLFQVDLYPSWIQPKRVQNSKDERSPGLTLFLGLRQP